MLITLSRNVLIQNVHGNACEKFCELKFQKADFYGFINLRYLGRLKSLLSVCVKW